MINCAHIFFSGHVQGVFFRDTVKRIALDLGITGWVKNLSDGRVEAMLEGEKEKIEELIEKAKKGNPLIEVKRVDLRWIECKNKFKDFKIKRGFLF
jgi:acylphosphatase